VVRRSYFLTNNLSSIVVVPSVRYGDSLYMHALDLAKRA
jgi:hypothetical protein